MHSSRPEDVPASEAAPSIDPAPWLERFLDAYPDGDREEFEGWAQARSELSSAPELLAATFNALERWHAARRPAGEDSDKTESIGLSSFRRSGRVSETRKSSSTGRIAADGLRPGQRIGAFTLLRFIARGGMGEVWEAEDASVRRRIALKLVLPDRVDAQSLALFAREARAGGRLNHPNLVTTLGHGTDGGLAWISQELVEGSWTVKDSLNALRAEESVPKDYYREVSRLVASIADGMQAAHDAGVIHRDLKPQNILISDGDQPKVTDFGLARVADDTFQSQSGMIAGTWAYMSPEQVTAKRRGMDHRTDIFSLGVVLYELLTLRRPFEGDTTHQIATRILTEEARSATKVRSQCPSELSVICAKAMEKAPDRRYATMAGFAADLRRHLANEPIEARPPGPIVRSTKWVRRHPAISAAGVIAAVALVVVSILSLNLAEQTRVARASADEADAARAETEEALAKEEARREELSRVASFQAERFQQIDAMAMGVALRSGLRTRLTELGQRRGDSAEQVEADLARFERLQAGTDMTGLALEALEAQILRPSLEAINRDFIELPPVRAQLLQTFADSARTLGLLELAGPPQEEALELRREILGDEDQATLRSRSNLGLLLMMRGQHAAAEPIVRETLEAQRRVLGADHRDTLATLTCLGPLLSALGKTEEAGPLYLESLQSHRRTLGEDDPDTLAALTNLGALRAKEGQFDEAISLSLEALEAFRRTVGDHHRATLAALSNMGDLLDVQGKFAEAEPFHREALEGRRRVLGDDHPDTVKSLRSVSTVLFRQGKFAEATPLYREALDAARLTLGDADPETLAAMHDMGVALNSQGMLREAIVYLREALDGRLRILGEDDPATRSSASYTGPLLSSLDRYEEGRRLSRAGKHAEAEASYRDAYEMSGHPPGTDLAKPLFLVTALAKALESQDKWVEAEPYRREAYTSSRLYYGDENQYTVSSLLSLSACWMRLWKKGTDPVPGQIDPGSAKQIMQGYLADSELPEGDNLRRMVEGQLERVERLIQDAQVRGQRTPDGDN